LTAFVKGAYFEPIYDCSWPACWPHQATVKLDGLHEPV